MSTHEGKRLPRPTPVSRPWWEACRRRQLLLQRCTDCGRHQFYPRTLCAACGGTVDWVRAAGRGRVLTYTVVRHPVSPAYADEIPLVLALIELEEGPVMMSSLSGCAPDEVGIGLPVEVLFEEWTAEITMPRFRPAGADGAG